MIVRVSESNRIEILACAMIEVQNEVDIINKVKQKESEIDIETLKLMHEALEKILKKWRHVIIEMLNSESACSKPGNKNKDNKPDDKKKDNKPDIKKKDNKPDNKKEDNNKKDTKKNDNKPDTEKKDNKTAPGKKDNKPDTKKKDNKPDNNKKDNIKKDNKPDTKKKDNKPDNNKKKDNKPDNNKKKDNKPDNNKKKDNKPDTSKNNIENRVSNRIIYEMQDIISKVLIKMIDGRMYMLGLINLRLTELTDNIDIDENVDKFRRLCHANQIKRTRYMMLISYIYA